MHFLDFEKIIVIGYRNIFYRPIFTISERVQLFSRGLSIVSNTFEQNINLALF